MLLTKDHIASIKSRLAVLNITQEDLALAMSIDGPTTSRILSGKRPAPNGFVEQTHAVLDRLERAKTAAAAEYRRVMAEGDEY